MSLIRRLFYSIGIGGITPSLILSLTSCTSAFTPSPLTRPDITRPLSATSTLINEGDVPSSSTARSFEGRSTLTLLDHVNLNVPNHTYILEFYLDVLGMGLDPRKASNVAKGSGTVWANCGASQFHLPYGEVAQVLPGSIGLRYDDLSGLKDRLSKYDNAGAIRPFETYSIDTDAGSDQEHVRIVDRYGNVFYCRVSSPPSTDLVQTAHQPILTRTEYDNTSAYVSSPHLHSRYAAGDDHDDHQGAFPATDCRGISYVEFRVKAGSTPSLAEFYECVFDAPTTVLPPSTPNTPSSTSVAIVGIGTQDPTTGRFSQSLIFRESPEQIPEKYDGHHISLYVGDNSADHEAAFKRCEDAGVVWVNRRFSDDVANISGLKKWRQFRFKDLLNLGTGKKVLELEHEIRSINHGCWPGERAGE